MTPVLALLGLLLGAWSVRSICLKSQSNTKKIIKSILSAWYFLGIGSTGIDQPIFSGTLILLFIGAAVQFYFNKRYVPPKSDNEILREHAEALKDFNSAATKEKSVYREKNYISAKKNSELSKIAFSYENSKGERSFRDVDVKSFDGQYIEGYCHLSRKFKTFRLDRIEGDVIIRETGESLDAYEWASYVEGN